MPLTFRLVDQKLGFILFVIFFNCFFTLCIFHIKEKQKPIVNAFNFTHPYV